MNKFVNYFVILLAYVNIVGLLAVDIQEYALQFGHPIKGINKNLEQITEQKQSDQFLVEIDEQIFGGEFYYSNNRVLDSLDISADILQIQQIEDQIKPQAQKIIQTFENKTFLYQLKDPTKYMMLEIFLQDNVDSRIDNNVPVLLLARNSTAPTMSKSNEKFQINARIGDLNGYYLRKNYLFVQIDPIMMNNILEPWYFCVVIPSQKTIKYEIIVSDWSSPQCPRSCGGPLAGGCQTDGSCYCNDGRLDQDCSQTGFRLQQQTTQNIKIESFKWVYLYYLSSIEKQDDTNLQIQIQKTIDNIINLYLIVEGSADSYLPNALDYNQIQFLVSREEQMVISRDALYYQTGSPRKIIFGLYTEEVPTASLSIVVGSYSEASNDFDSNLIIVYFLLGVAGVLFIVWIILTIIRIKYQRPEQEVANPNAAGHGHRHRRKKKDDELTLEVINQYMPLKSCVDYAGDNAKINLKEEACSVCLVEFDITDMIRNTICQHIFHRECLEQWLKKHQNCPMCRTGLSKKQLQEWEAHQEKHDINDQEQNLNSVVINNADHNNNINQGSNINIDHNQNINVLNNNNNNQINNPNNANYENNDELRNDQGYIENDRIGIDPQRIIINNHNQNNAAFQNQILHLEEEENQNSQIIQHKSYDQGSGNHIQVDARGSQEEKEAINDNMFKGDDGIDVENNNVNTRPQSNHSQMRQTNTKFSRPDQIFNEIENNI